MTKKTEVRQPQEDLLDLVRYEMPFGKYKGKKLSELPVSYLEWFARKGFPSGRLGVLLELVLTIKSNGLTHLLKPLQKMTDDGK